MKFLKVIVFSINKLFFLNLHETFLLKKKAISLKGLIRVEFQLLASVLLHFIDSLLFIPAFSLGNVYKNASPL